MRFWKKYIAGKAEVKSSPAKVAFRNWHQFFMIEAANDPLAMAIIVTQRQIIRGVSRAGGTSY